MRAPRSCSFLILNMCPDFWVVRTRTSFSTMKIRLDEPSFDGVFCPRFLCGGGSGLQGYPLRKKKIVRSAVQSRVRHFLVAVCASPNNSPPAPPHFPVRCWFPCTSSVHDSDTYSYIGDPSMIRPPPLLPLPPTSPSVRPARTINLVSFTLFCMFSHAPLLFAC